MKNLKNLLSRVGFAAAAIVAAGAANAGGGGIYDAVTDAADFSAVTTAVGVVAAAVALVYVAWKGFKMLISAIRGM